MIQEIINIIKDTSLTEWLPGILLGVLLYLLLRFLHKRFCKKKSRKNKSDERDDNNNSDSKHSKKDNDKKKRGGNSNGENGNKYSRKYYGSTLGSILKVHLDDDGKFIRKEYLDDEGRFIGGKSYGGGSGDSYIRIDKITSSTLNNKLIIKQLKSLIKPGKDEENVKKDTSRKSKVSTWKRPNRRLRHKGIIRKGFKYDNKPDYMSKNKDKLNIKENENANRKYSKKIVVCVDTSGSCFKEEFYEKVVYVINNFLKNYEVKLVLNNDRIKSISMYDENYYKNIKFVGGGGTCFDEFFNEWMPKNYPSDYKSVNVFVFTDMCFSYGNIDKNKLSENLTFIIPDNDYDRTKKNEVNKYFNKPNLVKLS